MDCSDLRLWARVALRALLEAGGHLPHLLKRVDGVQDLPLLRPAEGSLRVPHPSCDRPRGRLADLRDHSKDDRLPGHHDPEAHAISPVHHLSDHEPVTLPRNPREVVNHDARQVPDLDGAGGVPHTHRVRIERVVGLGPEDDLASRGEVREVDRGRVVRDASDQSNEPVRIEEVAPAIERDVASPLLVRVPARIELHTGTGAQRKIGGMDR